MTNTEQNIRNYLKTLTVEDIADSVYLFGMDFDKAPMIDIMEALSSLYEEVKVLEGMVERNFEQEEGKHVLIPKDRYTQDTVIRNYNRKKAALEKVLRNKNIFEIFTSYKHAESKNTSGPIM